MNSSENSQKNTGYIVSAIEKIRKIISAITGKPHNDNNRTHPKITKIEEVVGIKEEIFGGKNNDTI